MGHGRRKGGLKFVPQKTIAAGLVGVVLQPLKGLRTHTLSGLLGGVQRGIVGAVAKPVAGVLAMSSKISHTLADIGNQHHNAARSRRSFVHGHVLQIYDQARAAKPLRFASVCSARTLNARGKSRVTLSLG